MGYQEVASKPGFANLRVNEGGRGSTELCMLMKEYAGEEGAGRNEGETDRKGYKRGCLHVKWSH